MGNQTPSISKGENIKNLLTGGGFGISSEEGVSDLFASKGVFKNLLPVLSGLNREPEDLLDFDDEQFYLFIETKEHEKSAIDENLKKLPLLVIDKQKYKILNILGSGAFGQVIKVVNIKTKQLYALKSVNIEIPKSDGKNDSEIKEKEEVAKSAKQEVQLLPKLIHENIVKFKSSSILKENPLREGKVEHLVFLMEYVKGSDLDELIKFSEENEFFLSNIVVLRWWYILLQTIYYIHTRKISHRDLKPDNILVYYMDLEEGTKNMKLKLSDFGVGRDIKNEGQGKEIAGHIFYSSLEVLQQKLYDERCDVWALGIIFFQLFYKISMTTYVDAIKTLMHHVKDDDDLAMIFLSEFEKKDMYDGVTYIELMQFLIRHDVFRKQLIDPIISDEIAVKKILERMLEVNEKDRWTSKKLINCPIFRTWEKILFSKKEIKNYWSFVQDEYVDDKNYDMDAVFSVLKNVKKEVDLFLRCCEIIYDQPILEIAQLETLIKQMILVSDTECSLFTFRIVAKYIKTVIFDSKDVFNFPLQSKSIDLIVSKLREYCLVEDIIKFYFVKKEKKYDEDIDYLCYLLLARSKTLRYSLFLPNVKFIKLSVNKYIHSPAISEKRELYTNILNLVLAEVTDKALLLPFFFRIEFHEIFKLFTIGDQHFHIHNDFGVLSDTAVMELILSKATTKKHLNRFLELFYGYKKFNKYYEALQKDENELALSYIPPKDVKSIDKIEILGIPPTKNSLRIMENNVVSFIQTSDEEEEGEDDDGISNVMSLTSKSDKYEMISKSCLCTLPSSSLTSKNKVICYFELNVMNGGLNDNISLGFSVDAKKYYLSTKENLFYKPFNVGFNTIENIDFSQSQSEKIEGCSKSVIGVGMNLDREIFFTYNKKLIKKVIPCKFEEKSDIYAYVLFDDSNDFFKCSLVFDSEDFSFKFRSLTDLEGKEERELSSKGEFNVKKEKKILEGLIEDRVDNVKLKENYSHDAYETWKTEFRERITRDFKTTVHDVSFEVSEESDAEGEKDKKKEDDGGLKEMEEELLDEEEADIIDVKDDRSKITLSKVEEREVKTESMKIKSKVLPPPPKKKKVKKVKKEKKVKGSQKQLPKKLPPPSKKLPPPMKKRQLPKPPSTKKKILPKPPLPKNKEEGNKRKEIKMDDLKSELGGIDNIEDEIDVDHKEEEEKLFQRMLKSVEEEKDK